MSEGAMKFQWFEQHYLGGSYNPAEAEFRRISLTTAERPLHIDELGRLVDLAAESPRPEVQDVVSRSFSMMVQYNLKEATDADLARETERILKGLETLAAETRERTILARKIRSQLHALCNAALGSSPRDSIRFLGRTLGSTGAEHLVATVMGVTQ